MVLASEKDSDGWGTTDQFTLVLEIAGLNSTEPRGHFRERCLHLEQVKRWGKASQDATEKLVLTLKEQAEGA